MAGRNESQDHGQDDAGDDSDKTDQQASWVMVQPISALLIPSDFIMPICRVRSVTVVYIVRRITSPPK